MVQLEAPKSSRKVGDVELLYAPGAHGAEDEINVWGTVLQVGPGRWAKNPRNGLETGERIPVEVTVGDRVMVVWYLTKVETNKAHQATLGKDTIIIKPEDVICVDPQESTAQH
jgi:co-chaperonin GroES (HSP10)